jgi:hypothetical protein
MYAKLFSIGDKKYLNNAVVIADALGFITKSFGPVKNFKITFKKPFLSQGMFSLGVDKIDGHIMGQFESGGNQFYFAYTPTDIELDDRDVTGTDVFTETTSFNLCYHITDRCRGEIELGFEKVYGLMTPKDKVIFVIFEVPDTSVFISLLENKLMDQIRIMPAEQTGDRRFRLPLYVGEDLLGYRHSTVKEFII